MATIEEILKNSDARFYDGRDQTFNSNNIFQSGFNQGANTNYGVVNAPMNLANAEEEEFNPTQYLASEDIAMRNARLAPNDNRFTGIMRNAVARPLMFQAGANMGLGAGQLFTGAANPLFALAGAVGSQFLPLSNRPSDLDYDYVNQPGGISVVDNKIRGGVLSGKNFASGFGSNDLGQMYQNYIDKMEEEEELTAGQTQKLKDARNQLKAYLTTGRKMRGYETPDGKQMTDREFAFNYNQGIGQFAMPTTDVTGKTLDYTGKSDTYAGGEDTASAQETGNYDDPYDPGYAD